MIFAAAYSAQNLYAGFYPAGLAGFGKPPITVGETTSRGTGAAASSRQHSRRPSDTPEDLRASRRRRPQLDLGEGAITLTHPPARSSSREPFINAALRTAGSSQDRQREADEKGRQGQDHSFAQGRQKI